MNRLITLMLMCAGLALAAPIGEVRGVEALPAQDGADGADAGERRRDGFGLDLGDGYRHGRQRAGAKRDVPEQQQQRRHDTHQCPSTALQAGRFHGALRMPRR